MINGKIWKDTDGNNIQAHGGCIIEYNGVFYWYGENKDADNCPGTRRVDVIGVSCYSSTDLLNWKNEGLVLSADKDDPDSPLHTSKVLERPKVIYNEKSEEFIMWMHLDEKTYFSARVGIAVSKSPLGPFTLISSKLPNRQDCRDMSIYKDTDGTAYLIHSKDWNKTINIARLTADYKNTDGLYTSVLIDQEREAPALFKYKNKYYMITSGCTGWNPNATLYAESTHLLGQWKLVDNPCVGKNSRKTFLGQSTYVFETKSKFYLLLDHWQPNDLKNSGYSILPIDFEDDIMTITWKSEWLGI